MQDDKSISTNKFDEKPPRKVHEFYSDISEFTEISKSPKIKSNI